ncbi:hypothetical protein FOCC_FOCC012905 [Frankliniella occidentalis]|nr:hypothetical protein FOCC_FOCC012905 [Frankliniella occidentalis]
MLVPVANRTFRMTPKAVLTERINDQDVGTGLPLPEHDLNLPIHDISSEHHVGFDPTPVLPPPPQAVYDQSHIVLPVGCMESPTMLLPDMGHVTPKFPEFASLPVPEDVVQETLLPSVSRTATLKVSPGAASNLSHLEPDADVEICTTPAPSSLSMDLDAISLTLPSADLVNSTPVLETPTVSLPFPTAPDCISDDPMEAFEAQEGVHDDDHTFHDAFDYFVCSDNSFCEQEDPVSHQLQEDIEDGNLPGFHETDAFESSMPASSSHPYQPGADVPLYEGATVSLHDAATALLSFLLGCKISGQSLESKDSLCSTCKSETKVGFYIHAPLTDQLKRLYARPGFADLLAYRHHRPRQNPENYEDIYDGEIYKSNSPIGPLDITCMWNTDGLSLYKSSSFQVWPFYFSINELPPHLRYKEENILLGGIAFGYEKPHPNLLMKPIFEEVKMLRTTGIDVTLPNSNSPVNIKCNIVCGSCDAPAKAVFMRMNQFNGFFGCHLCYVKGEKSEDTGNVFVYPYEEDLPPRTQEQYKEDVGDQENGIKGPTYLFYMLSSFFLSSTAVDVMHCVYLGICRQIFQLYVSAEHIKPPRDLKHLSYFKASEFRVWLFSTALPVFQKHMKEPYLSHFKKLVCAIGLLNQGSVSKNDVEVARQLLKSFAQQWQDLFGLRHMSYNLHCLLHLPDVVCQLGPLWVSSCFPFENINGVLSRLVHGTRYAGLQIQTNLGLLRNLPSVIETILNADVKSFCLSVMSHGNRLAVTEKLGDVTYIVGKIVPKHSIDPVFLHILKQAFPNIQTDFFFRLKKDGFLYVCADYARGARDSSNVKYAFQGQVFFGCIKVFVRTEQQSFAVLQRYVTSYPFHVDSPVRASVLSLLYCSVTDQVDIVPVKDLHCVCFKMSVDTHTYLSLPLNLHELE